MNKINFMSVLIFMMMMIIMMIMINLQKIHPTYLILLMIKFCIMVCMSFSFSKENSLYSIILFLIMISGVLIIFLYFSSLISNEQSSVNYKKLIWMTPFIIIILLMMKKSMNFINYNEETSSLNFINNSMHSNIKLIYSYPFSNMTIKCMLLLLITLFSVIKITSLSNSPLRKIN